MRERVWLAIWSALLMIAARRAPPSVNYHITPEVVDGRLSALQIDVRMIGGPSGSATVSIPGSDATPSPFVTDLTAEGARVGAPDGRRRTLSFTPGSAIHLRYTVLPGENVDPTSQSTAPIIRPTWFAVHGDTAFILPEMSQRTIAHVSYAPPPAGWTLAFSLRAITF